GSVARDRAARRRNDRAGGPPARLRRARRPRLALRSDRREPTRERHGVPALHGGVRGRRVALGGPRPSPALLLAFAHRVPQAVLPRRGLPPRGVVPRRGAAGDCRRVPPSRQPTPPHAPPAAPPVSPP